MAAVTALVLGAAAGAAAQPVCPPFLTLDQCIDDFTCYTERVTKQTPAFVSVAGVSLVDQFETVTATVFRPRRLCLPADKNGEGTVDANTHHVSYSLKQSPRHIKRTAILVTNQIGSLRLDTVRQDVLLVPTAKDLIAPPAPPNPLLHRVDHYKCYRVRVTPGTPRFAQNTAVTTSDQFTTPAKQLLLVKPRHLCNPVDKNGEGIKNPNVHLVCYKAKPAPGSPKHIRRGGILVNNQFGPLRLDTIKEGEFCIPSNKSLSPSGAFLDAGAELFE